MRHKERLLARLDAIGRSLAETGHALALLGQGSSGAGLDRLDDYSDLDFFALVEAGHKRAYLDDLGWLSRLAPPKPSSPFSKNTPTSTPPCAPPSSTSADPLPHPHTPTPPHSHTPTPPHSHTPTRL